MTDLCKLDGNRGASPLVLHIVQSLRGGGAESLVRELVPRLRLRGLDARVLCAYGESQLTPAEAASWGVPIYCQPRTSISRPRYLLSLTSQIRKLRPDIVHTHTHVGSVWGRAAAKIAGVRCIVHTEHVSLERIAPVQRAAAHMLNRQTTTTVVFSARVADFIRQRDKVNDVKIIPNGVPVHNFPTDTDRALARDLLGQDRNHFVVGLISNLYPHKNPSLAIEALALLPPAVRQSTRLAIFGKGPMQNQLEERTKALGIQTLVTFYGFRSDVEKLLPGLDIALTTSTREMMPMSLLEEMNAGLPIIGTPHSGTLDVVKNGETGIILSTWDSRLLARAIEWAYYNPDWRVRAARASHDHLRKNFDIESVADQHCNLYWQLLGRGIDSERLGHAINR